MSLLPAPRFVHDCPNCIYLGQHGDGILFPHADLYFCPQFIDPTVIARYSDKPSDYSSGLYFGKHGINPALTVAYRLALERGLLTGDERC